MAEVTAVLDARKINYTAFTAAWPNDLHDHSEVWIIGGDGTMNYFINHYKSCQLPLVLFAGGTGNDFHWVLYGACTVEEQVNRALKGNIKKVDAGICNGYLFANGLGIGFDGAIVFDLLGKKKWSGKLSYFLSILKNIALYKEKHFQIVLQDKNISEKCFMISVANGRRYGGGFYVTPNAQLSDGLLDLSIISRVSLFQRLRYLPVMEKGNHLQLPFVTYCNTGKVVIECEERVHAHIDGEYLYDRRFEISVLPAYFSFRV
jgi:YegS/Rv2252/BmrU family lipid kinase